MKQKHRTVYLAVAALFSRPIARYDGDDGLPLQVETLDKVPEPVRALYAPTEDKKAFRLKVSGLPDVSKLESALASERNLSKEANQKLRDTIERYKDVDPEKYRDMMSKLDGDEEAQLIKKGEIDKVFEKRTEKMRQAHEAAIKAKEEENGSMKQRLTKLEQRALDNHVRAAATKAGIHPNAVDDALLRARSRFTLDPDGNAVELGEDGKPILDSSGKKPFTLEAWFEERKKDAAHWFPHGSKGGGGQGDGGAGGGGKTMKRSEFEAITDPVAKAKAAKENKIVDD
jgi:hypothetical protein